MGLIIKSGLNFFFFILSKGIVDDAQSFLGCFVDQTFFRIPLLFWGSILFRITCTSVTGGIMINRRQM